MLTIQYIDINTEETSSNKKKRYEGTLINYHIHCSPVDELALWKLTQTNRTVGSPQLKWFAKAYVTETNEDGY